MSRWTRKRRRGATLAFIAMALPCLLGFAALAVDLGRLAVAKQELQNVADAAALAGVTALQMSADPTAAVNEAIRVAGANDVLGDAQIIASTDTAVGAYDRATGRIIPFDYSGGAPALPDSGTLAVRVNARRTTGSANGPVATVFARLFGLTHVNMTASATAGLQVAGRVRPPVEAVIVQDQSGSFEDEFPQARAGNVAFVNLMKQAYMNGDKTGITGFGYQPNHKTDTARRRDINVFHDYRPNSNEDNAAGATATTTYINSMATIPYSSSTAGSCYTNLYTGMLKGALQFADSTTATTAWNTFVTSLNRSGTYYNIGWWRRNYYNDLKTRINTLLNTAFPNTNPSRVMIIVGDGMPWYHENSFPDTRSQDLCIYIADRLAARGIKIHVVSMDQSNAPADGSKGADSAFLARLCRNGGLAFYTYDARRLTDLMVGVAQVEIGRARLLK